jgi:hypothetical protein
MWYHDIIESFFSHICNGSRTKVFKLKQWVAKALHCSNDRTRPMLLLQGIQGGGQELFCSFLEHLFWCIDDKGNSFTTSSPQRKVWGRYNEDMLHCRLLCWVDINRVSTLYRYEANIKNLLNEPTVHVRRRGSEVAEDIFFDNETSIVALTSNNINYSDDSLTWLLDIRVTEPIPAELISDIKAFPEIVYKMIYEEMKVIAVREYIYEYIYEV